MEHGRDAMITPLNKLLFADNSTFGHLPCAVLVCDGPVQFDRAAALSASRVPVPARNAAGSTLKDPSTSFAQRDPMMSTCYHTPFGKATNYWFVRTPSGGGSSRASSQSSGNTPDGQDPVGGPMV